MRRILFVLILAVLIAPTQPTAAQLPEPAKSIEAAFQDVSRRTGQNYTRDIFPGTWRWTFTEAIGANLGCPDADPNGPRASGAYVITITVRRVGVFEYRATRDESIFVTCRFPEIVLPTPTPIPSPTFVPTLPPTAIATQAPAANAVEVPEAAAYIGTDGNVYVTRGSTPESPVQLTADAGRLKSDRSPFYDQVQAYGGLRWSPDGTGLLWMESGSNALYLASSGQPARRVISGLAVAFPAAWSPDGSEVAYVVATAQSAPNGPNGAAAFIYQIQAIGLSGGGPRVAGSFAHIEGCGGFNADPADLVYNRETRSFGGNEAALYWLPSGFLHTTNCGGLGIALTDFTGRQVWALENVGRVALAPDGTRAVAIRFQNGDPAARSLILIDLTNGETSPVQTEPGVDRAIWVANGAAIVYSTAVQDRVVEGNPASTVGAAIFDMWPMTGVNYTVNLYGVAAGGGRSILLFSTSGRGITSLSADAANERLYFSFVSPSATLIEGINEGLTEADLANRYPDVLSGVAGLPLAALLDAALPPPSAGGSGGFVGIGGWAYSGRVFRAVPAQ